MKNKFKVITYTQMEKALQIVLSQMPNGRDWYSKKDVMKILNAIYNKLLQEATHNAENGMYIQEVIDEHVN